MPNDIERLRDSAGLVGEVARFTEKAQAMFASAERPARYHYRDRKANLAYYFGRQDLYLDEMCRFRPHPLADGDAVNGEDARFTINNVVRKLVDDRISVICGPVPAMEAIPSTSEQADISLATVATKNADAIWRHLTMSSVIEKAHKWAAIYGSSFVKAYWDYYAGPWSDALQKPAGDIAVALVHPNRMFIDPAANRLIPNRRMPDDARWVFELQVIDVSDLYDDENLKKTHQTVNEQTGAKVVYFELPDKKEIGKTNHSVPTAEEAAILAQADRETDTALENASVYSGKKMREWREGGFVKVAFYYEFPNPSAPKGRFAAFLPDNGWWPMEYREELPYATAENPIGIVPFVQIRDVDVPGTPYGKARMTEARPIQDQINWISSQWFNDARSFTPYTIVDEDAGIDEDAIRETSQSRYLLWRSSTGGQKPELVFHTGAYGETRNAIDTLTFLIRQLEDKMQFHSTRYHPKSNPTATELQMMRTEDLRVLEMLDVRRAEEEAYSPLANMLLRITNWGYDDDRMIAFRNDKNEVVTLNFKKSGLRYGDITIRPGSSMPKNRTLQKLDAFEMAQQGFFVSQDPAEQRKLRREYKELVGFDTHEELDHDRLDAENAKSECEAVLAGHEIYVTPRVDNHIIHIQEKYRFLKTPAFRNLPEEERKRVYDAIIGHIDLHTEYEAEENEGIGLGTGATADAAAQKEGMVVPHTQSLQLAGAAQNAISGAMGAEAHQETNKTGGQLRGLGDAGVDIGLE
jgi:hypothetical protein